MLALLLALAASTPTASPVTARERMVREVQRLAAAVRQTAYRHDLRVDARAGRYEWDCSLMVAWLLRRTAPRSLAALGTGRPRARDFAQGIARAPTGTQRARTWRRIERLDEAMPGDVLAWRRPPDFPSRSTGHVAVVMSVPERVPGGVRIRIADSTRHPHAEDTRAAGGDGGFGFGTLFVATDEQGHGTAYGWYGVNQDGWLVRTPVVVGRPLR